MGQTQMRGSGSARDISGGGSGGRRERQQREGDVEWSSIELRPRDEGGLDCWVERSWWEEVG